ncbi:MAG TPA: hypothetical protein PLS58_03285 [Bacteroidales bacterium]|nr:hypothetical protein [Bacteroidales bacterium]
MKNYKIIRFLAILIMVTGGCTGHWGGKKASGDGQHHDQWSVIGPGGGGGVLKPTVSPFNKDFVMTHCDMTGVFVSHNGGMTWKMKNLWNVPDDFEFDPVDSNIVYISTRGFLYSEDRGSGISLLLRSADRGESWEIIYPEVSRAKKTECIQSSRLMPSEIIGGAIDGTIQKVEVDPANNARIYLGIAPLIDYMGGRNEESIPGEVFLVSTFNHGQTWNRPVSLPGRKILAIFPGTPGDKIIVFSDKVCAHIDRSTGKTIFFPLPAVEIIAVEGGKDSDGSSIYLQSPFMAGGKGGMYISSDLGKSWKQINNGLLPDPAGDILPSFRQALAVCESRPEVAYISVDVPKKDASGAYYELYCIYKTENGGIKWDPVLVSSSPGGYLTGNFSGSWMEQSYDPGWGGSPIDMGVAPNDPDVCFAGDNGRGYKTTDGGKSWIQVYSHNNPDGTYSSNGLNVTTCYGIHFDPFDRNHFFICYTDIGLFHTFSGGKSWLHSINGLPYRWVNTCYDLKFDPAIKGKVWSVWADAHDLPRTKMFGGRGFGGFVGGVAASEDGGLTWKKSNDGLPENSVCTNIMLDPESPAGSRTLYVSVFDRGIYKSTDDGKTWNPINNGLGNNLFAWQLRQNSNGRLFALFVRGMARKQTIDGSVYFSDDKGSTWSPLPLAEGVNGPHDLMIDPVNPDVMYVSCWPRGDKGEDTGGGVIKTTDGGKSWRKIFDERIRVNSAGMDPENPSVIYINTFQNSAFCSEDGGESWKRIEGYRFKWGQRAIPDIHNPGMLYLTTYGGSVFYGPAKGIPGSTDDITNMPDGWW